MWELHWGTKTCVVLVPLFFFFFIWICYEKIKQNRNTLPNNATFSFFFLVFGQERSIDTYTHSTFTLFFFTFLYFNPPLPHLYILNCGYLFHFDGKKTVHRKGKGIGLVVHSTVFTGGINITYKQISRINIIHTSINVNSLSCHKFMTSCYIPIT